MMQKRIDINRMAFGRAASEVAKLIIGKDSVDYAPNKLNDVVVVVQNVDKIRFSGRKMINKKYFKHSGYIGNLREKSLEDEFAKDPKLLFKRCVKSMLPKNRLSDQMIKKLIFK